MKKVLIVDDMHGWREFNSAVVSELLGDNVLIDTAESGKQAYTKVLEHSNEPYDIILTDLQMESDYEPKTAGEWLIEQIKILPKYYKTRIVIISAMYNIHYIAEREGVFCIPKSSARVSIEAYKEALAFSNPTM